MGNLRLETKNVRILYGVKKDGDFTTSFDNNFKVIELKHGDCAYVDIWTDVDTKEYKYRINKSTWLSVGDYIEHLYWLFRDNTNNKFSCYLPKIGDLNSLR